MVCGNFLQKRTPTMNRHTSRIVEIDTGNEPENDRCPVCFTYNNTLNEKQVYNKANNRNDNNNTTTFSGNRSDNHEHILALQKEHSSVSPVVTHDDEMKEVLKRIDSFKYISAINIEFLPRQVNKN